MIKGHVEGVGRVVRAIGKSKQDDAIRIADGIEKCCQVILKKSNYYCPVATGATRASGEVVVTGRGFGTRGLIHYNTPYVVFVHENLQATHAAPTCAKFLERATREMRGTCASILRRQFKDQKA